MHIFTATKKDEERFLRKKPADFDFSKYSKKEIRELVKSMRMIMKLADGVGLSANQIGLDLNCFVAEVDNKFYAIFNPKITKHSKETEEIEEGCLSVPNNFGVVNRADKVWLEGFDANEKKIKLKVWGFLARIFQHEVDHLNGKLFTDKCKDLRRVENEK